MVVIDRSQQLVLRSPGTMNFQLRFTASFGYIKKVVDISAIQGAAGEQIFHLYIDRYFCARIVKGARGWQVIESPPCLLTGDDHRELIEIMQFYF